MSSNVIGLLIVLFAALISANLIMAMRDEPLLLAWLNQILIGTMLIIAISYAVVALSTKSGKNMKNQITGEKK